MARHSVHEAGKFKISHQPQHARTVLQKYEYYKVYDNLQISFTYFFYMNYLKQACIYIKNP